MADILILIPARMASTRLPGKPLADIAGEPMIVHVMRRAQAARLGPVVVATDSEVIAACVEKAGGRAVMTRADHVSGSDRIFEALEAADPQRRAAIIVNVQGDLPTLAPADIVAAIEPLADPAVDIATLAAEIGRAARAHRPERGEGRRHAGGGAKAARALFHPRHRAGRATGRSIITSGFTPFAARRSPVSSKLPPSPLECRERLEQLRALEAGMRIDVAIVDSVPLGVDTPEDLERAREILASSHPVDLDGRRAYRNGHDAQPRRSYSRASRERIPTSLRAKSIPTTSRCRARPSKMPLPRSAAARPNSA